MGIQGIELCEQTAGQFSIETVARFAVNADELLLVGDDAGFDARVPRGMGDQPAATDFLSSQKFFQPAAGVVIADHTKNFRGHAQRGQIAGDVGRAAGHETFALEFNNRHGRFGRNARDVAPNELVEHHVAEDKRAGFARGSQDLSCARGG